MDYITVSEASEKWNISKRALTYHLSSGRISDSIKKGRLWLIPSSAQKPIDKRHQKTSNSNVSSSLDDMLYILRAASKPMPLRNPYEVLNSAKEDRIRLIYEAELAYLRGDFQEVMECYEKSSNDNNTRLRLCPVSIAATISTGDYYSYNQINSYLQNLKYKDTNPHTITSIDYALATTAVNILAPNLVPDWLKMGDLSFISIEARSNALYMRAKYFYSIGEYSTSLAIAQSALSLINTENTLTITDIYLQMTCAISCCALGRNNEAKTWLLGTMNRCLPHGFISPFSEHVTALNGLTEECLKQYFPKFYNTVMNKWEQTWKNWISFHNQFTRDNITLILTLREYHIALSVARGIPYSEIAEHYGISKGRVKNIILEIREKLFVTSREELKKIIL